MASSDGPVSLVTPDTRIKVSSTLDKSVGKKYLTDGNPDTCWTSQQGLPQYIQIQFNAPAIPHRLSLTFQGGFVGTRCIVDIKPPGSADWRTLTQIYPEDVNRTQVFDLSPEEVSDGADAVKLIFEESSDFFGRITVYDLNIEGSVL